MLPVGPGVELDVLCIVVLLTLAVDVTKAQKELKV